MAGYLAFLLPSIILILVSRFCVNSLVQRALRISGVLTALYLIPLLGAFWWVERSCSGSAMLGYSDCGAISAQTANQLLPVFIFSIAGLIIFGILLVTTAALYEVRTRQQASKSKFEDP